MGLFSRFRGHLVNGEPIVDRSRQTLLPGCPQSCESAASGTVVGICRGSYPRAGVLALLSRHWESWDVRVSQLSTLFLGFCSGVISVS